MESPVNCYKKQHLNSNTIRNVYHLFVYQEWNISWWLDNFKSIPDL